MQTLSEKQIITGSTFVELFIVYLLDFIFNPYHYKAIRN